MLLAMILVMVCEIITSRTLQYELFILGCLAGMEYQLCGPPIDCYTFRNYSNCSVFDCVSGCFCSNYYVLEDGKCIDPIMCPGELYY